MYAEFARAVQAPNGYFGRVLSGFDDCLFGGYGLECPAVLRWEHSGESRRHLDSAALVAAIPRQKPFFQDRDALRLAELGELTLFEYVVDLISSVPKRSLHDLRLELELE